MTPNSQSLQGKTLKKQYYLREMVGSGGMADVYDAWDVTRSARMAVKVLRRDLAARSRVVTAFKKESEFLQELSHPYIVRFYDYGEDAGVVFIVMAWVDGTDLKKRLDQTKRPFSVEETLGVLRPICSALNFAHQKGRYHCDIKPSNILLHENGKDTYLADFGVAHVAREQAGGGTLPYMAPEQFTQDTVSAQTDIYSLAITVYQLLTGELPYQGNSQHGSTLRDKYEYEHSHLPLPEHPKLPPGIFRALQKAASKRPADRYKNCLEFLDAFAAASGKTKTDQTVLEASPPPLPQPPQPSAPFATPNVNKNEPRLYARSGDFAGQSIQLYPGETLIGRSSNCHIRLMEKSVSRMHATIIFAKKGIYIRDEGSSLGTYVNGDLIPARAPILLRSGDVIQIGYYQIFEFRQ